MLMDEMFHGVITVCIWKLNLLVNLFFHFCCTIVKHVIFLYCIQKTPKKEIEKALKVKRIMKMKNKNSMSLSEFKDENYRKRRTKEREELESEYKDFKTGSMLL